MSQFGKFRIGKPPLPANGQFVNLLDTTRFDYDRGPFSATSAPGDRRGRLAGRRVRGFVKPTGANVVVRLKLLTNPDGTTGAAFEDDTTADAGGMTDGVVTVTDGTAQLIDWLPRTGDYKVECEASGTLTDLESDLSINNDESSGQ